MEGSMGFMIGIVAILPGIVVEYSRCRLRNGSTGSALVGVRFTGVKPVCEIHPLFLDQICGVIKANGRTVLIEPFDVSEGDLGDDSEGSGSD